MKLNVTIEINDEELKKLFGQEFNVGNSKGMVNSYSQYARFYDEQCIGWTNDSEYILTFLTSMQNYCNDLLKVRRHLFLNEVYDMLGIPRTKAGAMVGWIYDEKHPIGDNYVDFGIYDETIELNREFVNGNSAKVLLDFNVDGVILDYIE